MKNTRVLIVGVGSIGERHLRYFGHTDRTELSICETNEALREQIAARYSIPSVFGTPVEPPLTAAISSDEGKTWKNVRDLESDAGKTYSYTSLTFAGGRAVLSYWESDANTGRLSTRFRALPVSWFYD